jgi:hypothetical protein
MNNLKDKIVYEPVSLNGYKNIDVSRTMVNLGLKELYCMVKEHFIGIYVSKNIFHINFAINVQGLFLGLDIYGKDNILYVFKEIIDDDDEYNDILIYKGNQQGVIDLINLIKEEKPEWLKSV